MPRFRVDHTPPYRTVDGKHQWDYRCGNRLAKVRHISHGVYKIFCREDNQLIETRTATNRKQAKSIGRDWVTE